MVPFRLFLLGSSSDCLDGASVLGFRGFPKNISKKKFNAKKLAGNLKKIHNFIPSVTSEEAMAIPV